MNERFEKSKKVSKQIFEVLKGYNLEDALYFLNASTIYLKDKASKVQVEHLLNQ